MKRDPALRSLSRDHHQALVVAQALRRAEDRDAASRTFLEFWRAHGLAHFRIEEDVLFAAWAEAPVGCNEDMVMRAVGDHHLIRRDARRIGAGRATLEELRDLGHRLEAHVRFEEREMFPAIEASMPADALTELAREVEQAESDSG